MDVKVKQRLIGALVLGALAIIFVPMIVIGPERQGAADAADLPIEVPNAPDGEFVTRVIPMGPPGEIPAPAAVDGVAAPADPSDPNALATVDATATTAPRVDALDAAMPAAVDAATGLPSSAPVTDEPLADAPTPAPPAAEPLAPVAVATPAPAPTPPPAPAAVAAGDFTVTAGTFGQRSNADALVARLKSSGLPAFTEAAQVGGQPATRVKVGPFADRAAAEAARVRTAAISGTAAVTTGDAPATATRASTAPAATTTAAAASAPAATRPTQPAASSGFAVQLGAFSSQSDAQALVSRARAAGFSAFEARTPTANGVLWRVRLGPVADRAAAEAMKSDAAGRLGISGNVVTHP